MIVTFWKGVFVADTLDERGALSKAGFDLHEPTVCHLQAKVCKACRARIGRRYWSDRIEAATRLKEFCNERALAVMKEHLARIAKSRAVDANIVIPAPEGLEYMGFQKAGIAYALQRKDTLIADEMGLGKSIQALGFVNALKPKNVLVICPSTLIFNWRNEAMKWLVGDYEVFPVNSKRDVIPNRDGMFVIVNYEKLTGASALSESLMRVWDVLVVDEVHMIKNINAERTKAVIGENGLMRRAHRCLFLSGTPIENYPKEIWPVAAAMCPAKFGDWWDFARRYCTPPESPVWFGDFSFRPIGSVKIGDELIGWRKRPPTKAGHQRLELCRSTVTAINRRISKIVKVTTEENRIIRCTPDHRWLSGSNKKEIPWTSTKVGRAICHVIDPTSLLSKDLEKDAHWLGGIFDGEGTGTRIAQSPKHNPEIYKHIGETLDRLRLPYTPFHMGYELTGGRRAAVDFINWCKPIKKSKWIDQRILSSKFRTVDHITQVEDDGEGEVIGLTTTTGNYIVWGYASKNCGLHQEERNGRVVWVTEGSSNLAELQQRLRATFMVRRLKKDVLTELPPKRRQLIALEDSRVDWSKHPQFKRWKEIYEKQYDERMAKLEAAKTEGEYKVAALALEKFTGVAFDEMSEFRHTTAMAKLPLCIKYIEDLLASGIDNLVVFAHHIDVIEKLLEHFEDDAVAVYGKTSREDREKNVQLFQELKKRIFIGQIRTAGVGITLTAANTVVFVEIDWVPGVLSQCEDRLCRIGQKKMVHVIHLILGNTLDANMVKKVVGKQIVIDKALDNTTDLKLKMKKTA